MKVAKEPASDENGTATAQRATVYMTLERATTSTGWRLVTFSLGPAL